MDAEKTKAIIEDKEVFEGLMKQIYKSADTDASGSIDTNELKKLVKMITNELECPCPTEKEYETMFNKYDANGDRKFSLEEFSNFMKDMLLLMSTGK